MLRGRFINGTEQHFLNKSLKHWNRFGTDLPVVMIPEIRALLESAKNQGLTTIGVSSMIHWYDLGQQAPVCFIDNTEYYSIDPECVSAY